ncbi:Uncharacterised protein [Metamycoplasma salivarium]|uniref:Uncharacterized protein n=2 Tax=Metamycoplasma salivarium TaxID=2124 RepID=A0A448ZZB1_METSV|nr:hypothetical protein MSATCC23557_3910 [Metamycoplasma salivarium]CAD7361367.1 Uncharacterised protein [Metamycoplasma salivarium]VEU56563.1 Uncharacterised protein [Metamycoplasma salivarium]
MINALLKKHFFYSLEYSWEFNRSKGELTLKLQWKTLNGTFDWNRYFTFKITGFKIY